MSISDIITIVGLIIAIIAIISEKNRQHLWLKMRVIDYLIFATAFLLINYFVFFDPLYAAGFYLNVLMMPMGGLKSQYWSYLITMLSLFYLWYKIELSFYSSGSTQKVYRFYQNQIENGEIQFLLDLLERYHKKDMIRMINAKSSGERFTEPYRRRSFFAKRKEQVSGLIRRLFSSSWQNRKSYASFVLGGILSDKAFLQLSANVRPYFFTDIISHFGKAQRGNFPSDLIKNFYTQLLDGKNFWLQKELKESQNADSGQPERYFDENLLIAALLRDLSVPDINEIWQAFGDVACTEIAEERLKGQESKFLSEYRSDDSLWEYKTQYAIIFFKILIEEALAKKYVDTHFFLHYYGYITKDLLQTLRKFPIEDPEKLSSNAHHWIETIIDHIFHWLYLANKWDDKGLYHNILDCLGSIIYDSVSSPDYGEDRKIRLLDQCLRSYCSLKTNENIDGLRSKFEEILCKPSRLMGTRDAYYTYFEKAWKAFDKVPHDNGYIQMNYFIRLKANVITPLGYV
jgi:hypothetical protein